jgi:hypothetical protein
MTMNGVSTQCKRSLTLFPLLVAGCLESELAPTSDIAREEQPIAMERPGLVELVLRKYTDKYSDPDITLASYAAPMTSIGCSATMIGPNVVMTAGHCDDYDPQASRGIQFGVYRDGDPAKLQTEFFSCKTLYHTYPHTDLSLLLCAPNAAGENPGDKYGYIDFDPSPVPVGQELESLWWNPVETLSRPSQKQLLYSPGTVLRNTDQTSGGSLDAVSGPLLLPIGISSNIWTQPGASGSSSLNRKNHRIMVGPTSTGLSDLPSRTALSIRDYLQRGMVMGDITEWDGRVRPSGLRPATIASVVTVPPTDYLGSVDKNRNYLFDIQEDVEKARGENARDWYWLGFESERRNNLWTKAKSGVWFYPSSQIAWLYPYTSTTVLRHTGLKLKPYTTYRISLTTTVYSTPSATALAILFQKGGPQDARFLSTVVTSSPKVQTLTMTTGSESPDLAIWAAGGLSATLGKISLIEEGATMDFDTADKRATWRNEGTGQRALIVPSGRTSGGIGWAAAVTRGYSTPVWNNWTVSSHDLALQADTSVQICFNVKDVGKVASDIADWGEVRVTSGGAELVRQAFRPTSEWTTICTTGFTPTAGDSGVMFGARSWTAESPSYLVDNVTILPWWGNWYWPIFW